MSRHRFRPRTANLFFAAILATTCVAPTIVAAIRAPGKYNGVVYYDRWGNCYLFSGVYLMYISDRVKESLRQFRGKSIEIDAKEVYQPLNPGDGLITKLDVLGESKDDLQSTNRTPPVRGVVLRAAVSQVASAFKVEIGVTNDGSQEITIDSDALGFAVIAHGKPTSPFSCPSDGTSCAVITRVNAISLDGKNSVVVKTKHKVDSYSYGWTFGSDRFPNQFTLRPREVRTMSVILNLHKGEYQFIAGYGGGVHSGPSVASDAVDFDVLSQ